MLKLKVRNLTVTAITIVSATMLVAFSATGASATTTTAANPSHALAAASDIVSVSPAAASASAGPDTSLPTCYKNGPLIPWTCVQVIGAGLHIGEMTGWIYNPKNSIYGGQSVHIELYKAGRNQAPGIDTPVIRNCDEFLVPEPGHNSDPCPWGPSDVQEAYYCAALWWFQNIPPNIWTLLGWRCVYVHP
jgi:hypothetical protein